MTQPLLATWRTHASHLQRFVDALPEDALEAKLAKGRTVGAMLTHLHHNRLAWLEPAAPDLYQPLEKIEKSRNGDKKRVAGALVASAAAVEQFLARSLDAGGRVKGFGGHAASFLAYLIAHDFYHLGEIGILLGEAGIRLGNETAYGIWEWRERK